MSSEKLISEVQKICEIMKSSDANWDVIELTQLLKALGFQLEKLDFDVTANAESSPNNLTVEIRCGSSKIASKLFASQPRVCLCPSNCANNSFWEVQGSAPGASGEKATNTNEKSSNLLPEVPKIVNDSVKTLICTAFELFKTAHTINNESNIPEGKNDLQDGIVPNGISSPKDDVFLASIRAENDRDIKILQHLSEARYKMDQALLMLKFNGRLDGNQNSLLMVTPQKPSASSSPKPNRLARGKTLTLPPRGGQITQKRRSVGSFEGVQPMKKTTTTVQAPSLASGTKKKLAVKENITSNLRKSLTLSQSMPKLPTASSAKK